MKIAYLSAGISAHDRRFLSKLVERGHTPFLISFWGGPVDFNMEGVKFYHYRPTLFSKIKKILYLRKLLKKIKPDVVHTGFLQTHGFIGAFAGHYPILSTPWGSDILLLPQSSLYNKLATKFVLSRATMISCDCELMKNRILKLVKYDPQKIVVIPRGADLKIFYPRASKVRQSLGWQDKKVLIMTRHFGPVYGIEYFINALPRIIEKDPDIRVIMVGDGPLLMEIKHQVITFGLDPIVHFAGFLDPATLADHFNAADIYVSTSLSDGSSVSLLEAMACRLPVVVTDLPSNREWIEDGINGYVVPVKDSVILAKRIVELAEENDLRKEMAAINLKIVKERADWDKNFAKFENMYKTICRE